jgi:hypothetical protein
MRGTAIATAMILTMACSSENPSTTTFGPSAGPERALRWEGAEACSVGLVQAAVNLPEGALVNPSIFYPGSAIVRLTIDGFVRISGEQARFRSDGREVQLARSLEGTEIELFAGLGGDCDWIGLHPII